MGRKINSGEGEASLRTLNQTRSAAVLAIVGPTASGKTPLSIALAEKLKGEIVSADSRQIYRFLDIGTAKPSASDLRRIPHHFIGTLDPEEEYSAGQYGKDVRKAIAGIQAKKKTPILVGGSGLYIRAAVDGLFEGPERDPEVRFALESELREKGLGGLLGKLKEVDPDSYAEMKREPKERRVVRALEVYMTSGRTLSEFKRDPQPMPPLDVLQIAMDWPRAELYQMIDERVERMMEEGFLEEVRNLKARGYDRHLNALNTVGYKELFEHLEGKYSLDVAVEAMKRNTRRFAKRQLTWFRKDKRIRWIPMERKDLEAVEQEVLRLFRG